MKTFLTLALTSALLCSVASAQSPAMTETGMIGGKAITIKYAAPSVRGRKIFGDGGQLSKDGTYPIWRAGANNATALHTEAALTIGTVKVPAGDYTLYVNVKDENAWELVINKQTKQWGTVYDAAQDLGRTKMTMSKPAAAVEVMKYTLTDAGSGKGSLALAWDSHVGTVPVVVSK